MSQEQNTAEEITKLTTDQVAEYLRINPEFFESNLDLLAEIQIPHISGEGTTSLIERQVQVLREQNEVFKDQLKTFAVLAGENEELWYRIKDLAVMLLKSPDKVNLAEEVEDWIKQQYNLSGVVISLGDKKELLKNYQSDELIHKTLDDSEIQCGTDFSTELLDLLFAKNAEKVKSCALIPLINEQKNTNGILALGSENTERFNSEQSTAYLDCLSQIVSQALVSS